MANPYRDRQGRFATPEVGKKARYELLFERFLDPNRTHASAPDIGNTPEDQAARIAMQQFLWANSAPVVAEGA